MSTEQTVAAIIHGYSWPAEDELRQSRHLIEAVGGVSIYEAREDARTVVGAAALINRAVGGSHEEFLLVLEPSTRWTPDHIKRLLAATGPGLALSVSSGRSRLWSMRRDTFERLGGLDERLWSGGIDDLQARARIAGLPVTEMPVDGRWIGPEAYPFSPTVSAFFERRDPLITAFKTGSVDTLGRTLAIETARGITAAWNAAGLDAAAFGIGGRWRNRRTSGAQLWPRDEQGTVLPLLAIDSFISDLTKLAEERRRILRGTTGSTDAGCGNLLECIGLMLDETSGKTSLAGTPGGPERSALQPTTQPSTSVESDLPRVSVIIVNWNGREHLRDCFDSLVKSDYPADRLELLLVDNGSTDDSRAFVQSEFPSVRVVALEGNRGFTGGNNAGVAAASGDVFVFFNNDMRVDAQAVARLVRALDADYQAAGARVLSWDGRSIDFISGILSFESFGIQERYGQPNHPDASDPIETFFPNGGAFAVTRTAYEQAGGFDNRFFAYYDDVDLGWRLRMLGTRVRVVHDAIVYHRHGATSRRHPSGQKRYLMERNALWTVMKNYEEATLQRVLGGVLLLAVRRLMDTTDLQLSSATAKALAPFSPRCRRGRSIVWTAGDVYTDRASEARSGVIRMMRMESLAALGSAVAEIPSLTRDRRMLQSSRVVPDAEILPLFGSPFMHASTLSSYVDAQNTLVDTLQLQPLFQPPRLLIVTHEPLGQNVSGPGVRVLEIARALSNDLTVTVATPATGFHTDYCRIEPYTFADHDRMRTLAGRADVLLVQGHILELFPFLKESTLPIVVDLYCPFTLEHLEMSRVKWIAAGGQPPDHAEAEAAQVLGVQTDQLRHGDFFICASERQRDFWLGGLQTAGRINPKTYSADPTLRNLIDVVPFGVSESDDPVRASREPHVLKGRHPAIRATDIVLLWGGSILDWQDPHTLIRAVAELARERDDIKLFFMGTKHPNPQVPPMRAVTEAIELARRLQVLDTHVIFNDWVPYADRARYLVDADIGVSAHPIHLETRFAFRTRLLDYIWAGLPVVCTKGDHFADLVESQHLGLTVPAADPQALASAIRRLADDPALRDRCREHLASLAEELRWSRVVEPLRRFVMAPAFASDRAVGIRRLRDTLGQQFRVSRWIKRRALGLGVSEQQFERFKQMKVVQFGMGLRNRLALDRAWRAARSENKS